MKRGLYSLIFFVAVIISLVPALAHQPFFEEKDFTADNPAHIKDPTISTAMYATLETPEDVDYYSFNGSAGQSILLSITIPQIPGQENFAPIMALMGPGLPPGDLPQKVVKPQGSGVLILPSPPNATPFFEPFSRTSYWTRQEQYVSLPANGSYSVAVWDDEGQDGRYVFVIGDREIPGGDLAFPLKMKNYWTPINQSIVQKGQESTAANKTSEHQDGSSSTALPGPGTALSLICMATMASLFLKKLN